MAARTYPTSCGILLDVGEGLEVLTRIEGPGRREWRLRNLGRVSHRRAVTIWSYVGSLGSKALAKQRSPNRDFHFQGVLHDCILLCTPIARCQLNVARDGTPLACPGELYLHSWRSSIWENNTQLEEVALKFKGSIYTYAGHNATLPIDIND